MMTFDEFVAYMRKWYGKDVDRADYAVYVEEAKAEQDHIDRADAWYSRRYGF